MTNFFKRLTEKWESLHQNEGQFPIAEGLPQPIANVNYSDQLRIIKTLDKLPVGGSFPVRNELVYTVRKMAGIYHPEYKIVIRNFGDSYRAFRQA